MEGEALYPGGFALKLGQHRRCCFYELFGVDRFSGEAPEAPGIVNPLLFSFLSYTSPPLTTPPGAFTHSKTLRLVGGRSGLCRCLQVSATLPQIAALWLL